MSVERVIVIDPGERVGWCRFEVVDGVIVPDTFVQGVHPLKSFAESLIGATIVPAACGGERSYDVIAWEVWRLYATHAKAMIGSEFLPVQLVGIIRACGWVSGARLSPLPASKKETGRKVAPRWMLDRLQHSSEEHDKDAILLASYWRHRTYTMRRAV